MKWRYWWIHIVNEYEGLSNVNIYYPSPLFKDISKDIQDMKTSLDINSLYEIKSACNKHVMPTVLCPWGEAEYIHQCGKISYD